MARPLIFLKKCLHKVFLTLGLSLWASLLIYAQPTTDQQLAAHYLQKGDYEKAVLYYEKLYNQQPASVFYDYYVKCLVQLGNFKQAEKLIKKQIQRFPNNLTYQIDLGNIYKSQGEENKAEKQYENAIKVLSRDHQQISELAIAFVDENELDYAIQTYQKGEKLLNGLYAFNLEIATIYGLKGMYQEMIAQYMSLLQANSGYLQTVQNALSRSIDFQQDNSKVDMLRTALLRQIQRNPEQDVFSELLIWLFVQKKDFSSAFVQAKAIDKRLKGSGTQVIDLARLCTSNEAYDLAIACYDYLIEKGSESPYYLQARVELLRTLNLKITGNQQYLTSDLETLEQKYGNALNDLGKTVNTAPLMIDFAHFKAFYLNKVEQASMLLEEVLAMPNLHSESHAKAKLELGDILLMTGDIWQASLYYSQVEKKFKHDLLGHEAKFRNAKISYYTGDFEWAQSQLDVLKASTSKLISNDAMDLSLLIGDNIALDTNTEAMFLYAKADLLLFQNKKELALATLDSILSNYPGHSLRDEVLFSKFKIYQTQEKFEVAKKLLEELLERHNEDILADDAIFELALLYETAFNQPEKAKDLYQELLIKHPDSLHTVEARKRFRKLRGDNIN